jgi:serine/threonine protein kinase
MSARAWCLHCCLPLAAGPPCPTCGGDGSTGEPERPRRALAPGTDLAGEFRLGRVLGEGGFGITYLGVDLTLEQRVAVKEYIPKVPGMYSARDRDGCTVVPDSTSQRAGFQHGLHKFLSEAKILARLAQHPNVVPVTRHFETNGTAYMVMWYLEGDSLGKLCQRRGGRLPEGEAVPLVLHALDGLRAVHALGLLHRDLKPDNLFVGRDGVVKLLDFGAAQYVMGEGSGGITFALTEGFAAIEQYPAHPHPEGPWTDVYAMGATLYRVLTGRTPPPATARGLEDDPLVPPEEVPGAKVSAAVGAVVRKALAPRGAARFPSAEALQAALLAALPARDRGGEKRDAGARRRDPADFCLACGLPRRGPGGCECGAGGRGAPPPAGDVAGLGGRVALGPGFVLEDRFLIGRCLRTDGLDVEYLGVDLETGERVSLVEFHPADGAFARRPDGALEATAEGERAEGLARVQALFLRDGGRNAARFAPTFLDAIAGFRAAGTAWRVFRFEEGPTLVELLAERRRPLAPPAALAALCEVLAALSRLHAAGETHGDVKPGAIRLTARGPRLLGPFYGARVGERPPSPIWTPGFAAPGAHAAPPASPEADVFGAGATLFHLLTGGRLPDAPSNPEFYVGWGRVTARRLEQMGVPADVAGPLRQALDPRPERRFPDANAFLTALPEPYDGAYEGRRFDWGAVLRLLPQPSEFSVSPRFVDAEWAAGTVLSFDVAGVVLGADCWPVTRSPALRVETCESEPTSRTARVNVSVRPRSEWDSAAWASIYFPRTGAPAPDGACVLVWLGGADDADGADEPDVPRPDEPTPTREPTRKPTPKPKPKPKRESRPRRAPEQKPKAEAKRAPAAEPAAPVRTGWALLGARVPGLAALAALVAFAAGLFFLLDVLEPTFEPDAGWRAGMGIAGVTAVAILGRAVRRLRGGRSPGDDDGSRR